MRVCHAKAITNIERLAGCTPHGKVSSAQGVEGPGHAPRSGAHVEGGETVEEEDVVLGRITPQRLDLVGVEKNTWRGDDLHALLASV